VLSVLHVTNGSARVCYKSCRSPMDQHDCVISPARHQAISTTVLSVLHVTNGSARLCYQSCTSPMDQHNCVISPARHQTPAITTRQTTGWRLPGIWDITALFPCQHRMTKATSLIWHDRARMAPTNMCNYHTSTAEKGWPSSSTAARVITVKNSALRNAN
jgi:hypothetical protein